MAQKNSGEFVRELREAKGLAIAEVAEKLGVSVTAVEKWEEGSSFPDAVNLQPLCDILGVSEEELRSSKRGMTAEEAAAADALTNKQSVKYGLGAFAVSALLIVLRYTVFTADNVVIHAIGSLGLGIGIGLLVLGAVWFFAGITGKASVNK